MGLFSRDTSKGNSYKTMKWMGNNKAAQKYNKFVSSKYKGAKQKYADYRVSKLKQSNEPSFYRDDRKNFRAKSKAVHDRKRQYFVNKWVKSKPEGGLPYKSTYKNKKYARQRGRGPASHGVKIYRRGVRRPR